MEFEYLPQIIERIIVVRKLLNLSQNDLAEKLNISFRSVSNYELGKNDIPLDYLGKLSDLTKVHFNWFLTGEMSANPNEETIRANMAYLAGKKDDSTKSGDVNTSNSSGVKYATGIGRHTQIYHMNDTKEAYNAGEFEILKTENERLKSELKKAERIIELLEKK